MELEDLKEIMALLKDTDVTEIQIEKEGTKLKIKREKLLTSFEISPPAAAPQHRKATSDNTSAAQDEDSQRLLTVTAPIVGTFYSASSPDAESFIKPGDRVRKGQVLCIIEAMKLMNEIESEVNGVLVRGLVENGQPVEYGEPLFLIEPE